MNRFNKIYSKIMLSPLTCNPFVVEFMSFIARQFCPSKKNHSGLHNSSIYAEQLKSRGFTDFLPLFTDDMVTEMRCYFENIYCHDPWRSNLGLFKFDEVPSDETNMGWFTRQQVFSCPNMLDTLSHSLVTSILEEVFKCKPTLGFTEGWWAYTNRSRPKGSQRFHRDFEGIKFIKLFIYLTDVSIQNGPTVYVGGSHKSRKLFHPKAMQDDEVISAFGEENIHTILGKAGSCFLADTRGIHKGNLPTKDPRLAIISQYCIWRSTNAPITPYGHALESCHDPYLFRHYLRPRKDVVGINI
jgi:hypothetical protein